MPTTDVVVRILLAVVREQKVALGNQVNHFFSL